MPSGVCSFSRLYVLNELCAPHKMQIKTIWSVLIREFELQRDTLPEIDYTTMIHTPKDPIVSYKRRHPVAA